MPPDEEVKAQAVDIFDQSLATEELDINPEANAFALPPPPPESGNPYRVKLKRGTKGWMQYPSKNGRPGYLATDIEARIVAPGAVVRQAHDEIVQQDLRAVLRRKPREPVRASPLAQVALQADEHVREIDEATDPHGVCLERNENIRQYSFESTP